MPDRLLGLPSEPTRPVGTVLFGLVSLLSGPFILGYMFIPDVRPAR